MKMKALFVAVMIGLTVMAIFILGNFVLAGVISIIVAIFDKSIAMETLKYVTVCLSAFEFPFVVWGTAKYYREEEEKNKNGS